MLLTKNSGVAIDVKAIRDDGTFEGYGSVFGNVDSYGEVVEPGAFTASLVDARRKGGRVKMLWQHDPNQPIGVWDDLAEDNKGLYVKGTLLKDVSPRAAEAYGLLKAGALDGLSIGYRVVESAPHADKQGVLALKKLNLKEVSIVTFAANERARVDSVKDDARIAHVMQVLSAGGTPSERQMEKLFETLGFSGSKSLAMSSAIKPHLRGEPEVKADSDAFWAAMAALKV